MPWKDLGEVVGKNGTIGNVDSTYVNNGGEPGVSVTKSGDDSAPDLTFEFENLVNDPLTSSEIEQISNDKQLTSSSVLNGTGLTTLWSRIKAKFAPKSHTHDASDITAGELAATLIANGLITEEMLHDGAVTGDKIANGSITKDKLEKTLGDSLSRLYTATPIAGLRLVRSGGLVQVNVDVKITYPTGLSSVAAIPEGYRPAWRIYRDVGCGSGYPVRFIAEGDAMSAYNYNGTAKENVSGGFSYITADPFPD